ncbi:hypothetical protein FOA52_015461 [Chlamydomonas sp. UWO 241]|nr:hypothetical protein FOA52_015461 [Chlamydomonas sp. UWO 241]
MLPGLLAANAAEGVGPTGAALALLDFRKAYDTIDRGFLIAVMEAVGVGDGVLAWTRTILTHTYASAEVNGFISAPRKYAAGVRQGCPAAPALFLFLGHALACFLRTCPAVGVEVVPGCRVTCPQYADDCMPLLRSCAPADVAALVETMAVFGRATGLVLNLGKCGILPLGSAGEGLLAGAEVAGLRVLDAGVSLGVPVSAGLPPPEGVTGVCRERLAAAYTKLARFPMSAFGRGHAAATYGVSRILFRAVHCGMTPEAERVLSRWTATLVDRSVGPDPPAELPRWASSVPGPAPSRTALLVSAWTRLELPAAQRTVQWREPTGDAAGHALFSPTDAARWLVDGLARVRDALPGMRTVTDLCVLWAWLAAVDMLPNLLPYLGGAAPRASPDGLGLRTAGVVGKLTCKLAVALQLRAVVDERRVRRAATVEAALALDHGPHGGPRATDAQVFAGLRGLEAAVPTLWRMPLLNARKESIWRLWPPARSVAVERAGELATMDLWDALASFAEGGGMPRGFVLSIPVAAANDLVACDGYPGMVGCYPGEEEAAKAAEQVTAAVKSGVSLPVCLASGLVRYLHQIRGSVYAPVGGGVVSASFLNAKHAVGGIGVEPRRGDMLRVLFAVESDAVADAVVRNRCCLCGLGPSVAVFDVLSDREEARHQALWPAFLAAKAAGKRVQFHRARLVVDGARVAAPAC